MMSNYLLTGHGINKKVFIAAVRPFKYRRCIYLNNAKAGCTTIKRSLISCENELGNTNIDIGLEMHSRTNGMFDFSRAAYQNGLDFVFTFVRNPFARVLSAYLDNIVGNKDECKRLREIFNISEEKDIDFTLFLELINEVDHADDDPHWRPQSVGLMCGMMPIHYVGCVENINKDYDELSQILYNKSTPLVSHFTHSTNALGKLEMIRKKEVSLITRKYHDDFELFGYLESPGIQAPTTLPASFSGNVDVARSMGEFLK